MLSEERIVLKRKIPESRRYIITNDVYSTIFFRRQRVCVYVFLFLNFLFSHVIGSLPTCKYYVMSSVDMTLKLSISNIIKHAPRVINRSTIPRHHCLLVYKFYFILSYLQFFQIFSVFLKLISQTQLSPGPCLV